ncbi:MAG: M48 family metallopeptidase [Bacteroidota bacterium]
MNQLKRLNTTTLIALLGITLIGLSCAKVVFTGRRQAKMIPSSQINDMSFQQYDEFLKKNKPIKSGNEYQMVLEVGRKIQKAAELYYRANGIEDKIAGFKWEYNVVKDDKMVNAFCMPGGKVVVYTGILPIAKDRDGLAVIMGHEVAHALANHGNERMSQQLGVSGAIGLADAVLSGGGSSSEKRRNRDIFLGAVGAGAQLGILLPFSRKHESEADEIGLYLMAIAGYDVDQAAPFWERMQSGGGQTPPEFMSTHPSPETRSQNLREWAPKAKELAKQYSLN